MSFQLLHSLVNISKFIGFLSPAKNIIALLTSIMLHCKREIRDLIQSISNMNEHVLFGQILWKKWCKAHVLNPSLLKNPYFVCWRIGNIKSNLTSYPSAEKGKANPILGLWNSKLIAYRIQFVRTIYFPFDFLEVKKLYVPNSLI